MRPGKGLDVGTANLLSAVQDYDGNVIIKCQRNAFIDIEATVFGNSPVKISVKLESDDKPNSAGSVVDLIRLAKAAMDVGMAGIIPEACAFYMKSPPVQMDEDQALGLIRQNWASN